MRRLTQLATVQRFDVHSLPLYVQHSLHTIIDVQAVAVQGFSASHEPSGVVFSPDESLVSSCMSRISRGRSYNVSTVFLFFPSQPPRDSCFLPCSLAAGRGVSPLWWGVVHMLGVSDALDLDGSSFFSSADTPLLLRWKSNSEVGNRPICGGRLGYRVRLLSSDSPLVLSSDGFAPCAESARIYVYV